MIFTDGVHLISDESLDELHAFAAAIGLKRVWFQTRPPGRHHYDLTTKRTVRRAIEAGARMVTIQEFVAALRRAPQYQVWKTKRGIPTC